MTKEDFPFLDRHSTRKLPLLLSTKSRSSSAFLQKTQFGCQEKAGIEFLRFFLYKVSREKQSFSLDVHDHLQVCVYLFPWSM